MAELVPNRFPATVAYDTNTGLTIKNAQADVYAVTDTSFTTPLPLVDLQGVPMAKLVSSNDGVFPPFVIDSATEYAEVVAKSGSFVTPMVSFLGGSGPQGEPGPPGDGIPDLDTASAGQVVGFNGTAAVWQDPPAGTGLADWDTLVDKPSTFPPTAHNHTVTEVSDSTTVGRALMKAADAQAARTAIGAGTGSGTSNLVLGTTSTTAMPGNRSFSATEIQRTAAGGVTATTVEGAIVELKASIGTGGGGTVTSSQLVVKYSAGAYPALPTTKPTGVTYILFVGPVQPTSGNVSGGIPSYVGDGATQILGGYEYRNLP